MNAINLQNDIFFKALQSNAVLIDSDLVGAARLLWTARAAELNLDIYREKLSFHFRGVQEEVYQRIEDILRQQYSFRSPLQNLYEHQKRGRLFFSIGAREKQVEGVSHRDYVPEYLPFYQVEVGYFSKESPNFDIVISSALSKSTFVEAIVRDLESLGLEKDPIEITKISISAGDVSTSEGRIDPNKLGRNSFYPFLGEGVEGEDVTMESYIRDYLTDSAPVLILIGAPGTGKSTFTRTLAHISKLKTVICTDEGAVESGAVLSYVSKNSAGLLILEDVDNLLKSREAGNSFMSALLNESEGVCENEIKIVITTNLTNIDKVDSALIRQGRTFDIVDFRKLTRDEAKVVADEENVDISILDDDNIPLADVFGLKRPSYTRLARRKKIKFGF